MPLTQALKRLGTRWTKHDSEYKRDSISGPLTKSAWARIFEIGLTGFRVNLTVQVERDADLEAMVAKAKKKLFRDVLPLLDAREIEESSPEET
jgi:hypothetical protein